MSYEDDRIVAVKKRTRLGPFVEVDGEAVRYHRIFTAGLTVAGLAAQCGVTPPYVSMIEHGRQRRVGPALFKKLRKALEVEDMHVLLAKPELAVSHK